MDRRTCRFASQRMGVLRRPGNLRMGLAESPGFIASAAHHRLGYRDRCALALAFVLRRSAAWTNAVATVWVLVIEHSASDMRIRVETCLYLLGIHSAPIFGRGWSAGNGGLGLLERRRERINLGVAGFALTVSFFISRTSWISWAARRA